MQMYTKAQKLAGQEQKSYAYHRINPNPQAHLRPTPKPARHSNHMTTTQPRTQLPQVCQTESKNNPTNIS